MTGIGMAMAGGASVVIPPHTNSITLTGGDTYNVSSASGSLFTIFNSVISVNDTGGVPPYSNAPGEVLHLGGGTSGASASIIGTTGPNNSVGFSGLNSVGDIVFFTLTYDSDDSLGAHASSTYPGAGSVAIHRTS